MQTYPAHVFLVQSLESGHNVLGQVCRAEGLFTRQHCRHEAAHTPEVMRYGVQVHIWLQAHHLRAGVCWRGVKALWSITPLTCTRAALLSRSSLSLQAAASLSMLSQWSRVSDQAQFCPVAATFGHVHL